MATDTTLNCGQTNTGALEPRAMPALKGIK